jgi:hypothetical protein
MCLRGLVQYSHDVSLAYESARRHSGCSYCVFVLTFLLLQYSLREELEVSLRTTVTLSPSHVPPSTILPQQFFSLKP